MTAAALDPDRLLIPRREFDFLLYEWLDLEGLLRQPRFSHLGRDTVDAVLELSARVAADTFLPHYKESDQSEPTLRAHGVELLPAIGTALRNYRDLGMFAAGFPEQLGGAGLPHPGGVCLVRTIRGGQYRNGRLHDVDGGQRPTDYHLWIARTLGFAMNDVFIVCAARTAIGNLRGIALILESLTR